MRAKASRVAAERAGRRAETLAALLLRLKGYRILERRFRCHAGEIDLIARRGRLVAFVEVKARADHAAALLSVTPRARRRIEAAATAWQAQRLRTLDAPVRFDIVTVAGALPRHHADAWRS
ncbi:YraN family protein [Parvularcula oceani]|uniref:YraN family protein n=1 Tax=Parvularcula oceani TaxID=1247963 RepID=UPI0004E140B6|nr:YraN family protein [Parvularcula oceani]